MKLISLVIPAYNSEKYLNKAVDSLLIVNEDIEIIIVNDGSTDQTLSVAKAYQRRYPKCIKVINQENGGHGEGINSGLKVAAGRYFKVVDSDDWLDSDGLSKLINIMNRHRALNEEPDLYITNFVYEHSADKTSYERDYSTNFPQDVIFNWQQTKKRFRYSKTLLMHALIYKTDVLRQSGIILPKHTFYVDNVFAYIPLPHTKKIYYTNLPLYRYFIGRSDQSITLENITKRYQQQIKVLQIMIHGYKYESISKLPKGLKHYMKHCLSAIMIITQMFTVAGNAKERRKHLKMLWQNIKLNDRALYLYLRYRSYNVLVNFLPWKIKRFVMVKGYHFFRRKIKLG